MVATPSVSMTEASSKALRESQMPLVSVLMPAYNHARWIEQSVLSIWNQSYRNIELLIVDDASTDDTYLVAKRLEETAPIPMKVLRNEQNLGVCGTLNRLIAISKGDFIMIQADDDIALPNKADELLKPLLQDSSISGVHSALEEIDLEGRVAGRRNHSRLDREYARKNLTHILRKFDKLGVVTQSHVCRRSVFEKFGGFSDKCTHEANVLLFREAHIGRVVYVEDALTQYRIGSGTSTSKIRNDRAAIMRESKKVANWHYSAANNTRADIRRIQHELDAVDYAVLSTMCAMQQFKYWRRTQILESGSVLAAFIGLVFLDRHSISAALKVFLPRTFLFLRRYRHRSRRIDQSLNGND